MNSNYRIVLAMFVFCIPLPKLWAQDAGSLTPEKAKRIHGKRQYSPYANRSYPTRPFFGDTHLHTGMSLDAGIWGTSLMPVDAYRFARGEQVTSSTGQPVKLSRPLDFLVVCDHSDNMGWITDLKAGKPELLADEWGKKWYRMIQEGKGNEAALEIIGFGAQGTFPASQLYSPDTPGYRHAWEKTVEAAEEYNEPGRFTAMIGYEWTSLVRGGNMHRNVIFRDGADRALQVVPFTFMAPGSPNPVDLWKWMAAYEEKTGGRVLAIPHNGNLANGIMFPVERAYTGKEIDEDYVEQRNKWERLYEVTQTKGDGETHPYLSPNDEFADFETWDKANLDASQAKTKEMLEFEYARSALKNGLTLEDKLGTNPYKFGLIGSSDAHTGLAAMEEENFFGKTFPQEPGTERMFTKFMDNPKIGATIFDWEICSAGYAAVWATENTRAAIWDAMHRRETYATTGTRMIVRFFGGWEFEGSDATSRNPAAVGYTKGVPMGANLIGPSEGKSPTFLVAALKDPIGANLDRIQVVKGWLDADGEPQERVYDVVWSGDRTPGSDGKLPPVGSTVDVANATWTNTIGSPELIKVWKDPEFDPTQRAFYYVRVLEIPTPRWTAYDAKRFGIEPPKDARLTLQERGYTSPIWYSP